MKQLSIVLIFSLLQSVSIDEGLLPAFFAIDNYLKVSIILQLYTGVVSLNSYTS